MALALVVARVVLAGVFAVAGLAKLRDLEGSRRAVGEFGVPQRLVWLVGTLLPLGELATAAALLPARTATWGAAAAAVLLVAFSGAIALNLTRGRAPQCRCFGQVHSTPVSSRMVARNLSLAVVATAVVTGQGVLVPLAAAAVVSALPAPRARRQPRGAAAPDFRGLADLLAGGRQVLVVFASQHCGPCLALAPDLEQWRRERPDLAIAVLEREDEGADDVFAAYGVAATPTGVLVSADGTIASAHAPGTEAIRRLVFGDDDDRSGWTLLARRDFVLRAASLLGSLSVVLALPGRLFAAPAPPKPCTTPRPPKPCTKFGANNPDDPEEVGDYFPHDCGGENCTNVYIDRKNCKVCGRCCPAGSVCAGGECVRGNTAGCKCDSGWEACCDGKCVSVIGNKKHCGGCGKTCDEGESCCGGFCRDEKRDPRHCGGCGNRCPADRPLCHAGKCVAKCAAPLEQCGKTCGHRKFQRCCGGRVLSKERYPDAEFTCCGGKLVKKGKCCNGKAMGPKQMCCGGEIWPDTYPCCAGHPCSYNAPACCGGRCVNLSLPAKATDPCRECGNFCGEGEWCRFGECQPRP